MAKHNDKLGSRSIKVKSRSKPEKLPGYYQRKVRKSLYYHHYGDSQSRGRSRPVPWINEAGFSIDTPLQVEIDAGCIILTVTQVS